MNRSDKQILRAFGAQEDTLGRFVRGEKGETMCPPSSFQGAAPFVILSERAERARAKDLLRGIPNA